MLLRRLPRLVILPGLLMLCVCSNVAAAPARVEDVRLWSGPEGTRLVLDLSAPVKYDVFTLNNPYRVVIDLANASIADSNRLPAGQGPVTRVRSGKQPRHGLRFVLDLAVLQQPSEFQSSGRMAQPDTGWSSSCRPPQAPPQRCGARLHRRRRWSRRQPRR
jgi:hypothetical protein